ncbi:MAG: hypothetical protein J6S67_10660 [Methanobrevibacter sp.]|nr:hypothetical protein [Methanobrevibacter sp.]
MELWIRTQDRMTLSKITVIKVEECCLFGYYEREIDEIELGEYKTGERALEVLNEIQEKILKIEETSLMVNPLIIEECVYEMPKE